MAPSKSLTVRQFFGRKGLLSEWHPNYEFREGQLRMAEAVEAALADKRHLIVEAGTGTGKTLSYLVPAILSGKRVIVSTGTKNLQEQIYFKDIPFLAQHLGELRACYMKGRANYACRQKIYDAENEPILEGLEEVADFRVIREWEKATETGDRAELEDLSFKYLEPEAAEELNRELETQRASNEAFLQEIKHIIEVKLAREGIRAHLETRVKRPFSVFLKLRRQKIMLA